MAKSRKESGRTGENVVFVVLIAVASVGAIACFILGGIAFFNGRGTTVDNQPRQSQPVQATPPPTEQTSDQTSAPTQELSTDQSSQPESEGPGKSEQNPQGNLGDYQVEIKGASVAQDYNGNPVIIVTYSWTNNSSETTSAIVSVLAKAFQDGIQLENAIVANNNVYDSAASMKDVRPGTTIDVQVAFVMTSDSVVEFELSEIMSLNGNIVAMSFDPKTS